jgi:hypothetical protein
MVVMEMIQAKYVVMEIIQAKYGNYRNDSSKVW